MENQFVVGDKVKLNERGAGFGVDGVVETNFAYKNETEMFFVDGATGVIVDTREETIGHGTHHVEYAVEFEDDPVETRSWWMCVDEIEKVVE
jgi:hypothetical protein